MDQGSRRVLLPLTADLFLSVVSVGHRGTDTKKSWSSGWRKAFDHASPSMVQKTAGLPDQLQLTRDDLPEAPSIVSGEEPSSDQLCSSAVLWRTHQSWERSGLVSGQQFTASEPGAAGQR